MGIIFESLVSARLIYILLYLILVHMPQVSVGGCWMTAGKRCTHGGAYRETHS